MKSRLTVLLVALALVAPLRAQILEQVLVKVNGDILTKTDLETRQIAALRAQMKTDVDAEAMKNDESLKKMLAEVTPRLLVDAIDEILMLQLGKEKGYKVTDEQYKQWLERTRKDQGLTDDAKFESALKQEGLTIDDLRHNFERQVVISQVQRDEVGNKLQITEEEARQYYVLHKEEFADAANVTLREIFVELPAAKQGGQTGINVAQEEEALQKMNNIRTRVTTLGEDFAKVAAEVSESATKANGGLIGPIAIADLSAGLQQTLTKMKPGGVTEVLRLPKGLQILKLEVYKPSAIQPFENVRDLVATSVHDERQQVEVRRFLARVRSQAIIEWKNAELKKMYETAAAQGSSN